MTRRHLLKASVLARLTNAAPSAEETTVLHFPQEHFEAVSPAGTEILLFRPYRPMQVARIGGGRAGMDPAGTSRLRVVDAVTGKEIQSVSLPGTIFVQTEWLPDTKEIVFSPSSMGKKQELFRWTLGAGSPVKFGAAEGAFWWLRSIGRGMLLSRWSRKDGVELAQISLESGEIGVHRRVDAAGVTHLDVAKDRKRAAVVESGGKGRILIVACGDLETILEIPKPPSGRFYHVLFHPDGRHLITARSSARGQEVEVRNLRDGGVEWAFQPLPTREPWLLADGKLLLRAAADDDTARNRSRATVFVSSWDTRQVVQVFPFPWTETVRNNPFSATIGSAGWIAPDRIIASTGLPETRVWKAPRA